MKSYDQWNEKEINKSLVKQLRNISNEVESGKIVCLGIDIINNHQDLFDREGLYRETRRTGEQRIIIDLYNDGASEFE